MTNTDRGPAVCGFCSTRNHEMCPGKIRNARKPQPAVKATATTPAIPAVDSTWTCPCGCVKDPICLDCKISTPGEVDPASWTCFDHNACAARVQAKMKEYAHMVTAAQKSSKDKAAKAVKTAPAPKVGKCLHTGVATKGGKFAPGQDAAYVSSKVKAVMAKSTTESAVIKEMKGHGLSDALQAKFTKGLGLAKAKADKAAAEKAEAAKGKGK